MENFVFCAVMTVNKLLTIASYLECMQYIETVKEGIRNAMTQRRCKGVLQDVNFTNNKKADKADKGYNVRPLITSFNESFSRYVSNNTTQSVSDYMTKFKRRLC